MRLRILSSVHAQAFVTLVLGSLALVGCSGDPSSTTDDLDSGTAGDATVGDPGQPPPGGGSTTGGGGSTTGGGGHPDAGPPPPPNALRFAVLGDSRTNPDLHQTVMDGVATTNPQLILDTGDLWDGYGSAQWKTITTRNANIAALLASNMYLVSRGNHETLSELLAFTPTLVRNNSETYGFSLGNAYFVSLGMDPSLATAFLENELKKPEAKNAAWRFVYSHFPIYSGGDHGASGDAAVERICDTYNVTIYFTGHDHIYERSNQIFGQATVDTTNALRASKGTVYLVAGGGGAPLYTARPIATTHFSKSTLNYVSVNATATTLSVNAFVPSGTALDAFTITR